MYGFSRKKRQNLLNISNTNDWRILPTANLPTASSTRFSMNMQSVMCVSSSLNEHNFTNIYPIGKIIIPMERGFNSVAF